MSLALQCSTVIEELESDLCSVKRKISFKDCVVSAVRNDVRQILIRISPRQIDRSNKTVVKSMGYLVPELQLYKNFLKQGKATILIPAHPVRLMLSNCPPDKLRLFLATLRSKVGELSKKENTKRPTIDSAPTCLSLLDEMSPLVMPRDKKNNQPPPPVSPSPLSATGNQTSTPTRRVKPNCKAMQGFSHVASIWQSDDHNAPSKLLPNKVINLVKSGRNVFCTGGAGTGKSHLIRKIIGILPPDQTAVTASTGSAANLIGGTTLHAFAGLGALLESDADIKTTSSNDDNTSWLSRVERRLDSHPSLASRWNRLRHLIIDEVSMIGSRLFTRLDLLARLVRGRQVKQQSGDNSNAIERQPFGGLQLIAFGDFFQLPPVSVGPQCEFAFESPSWASARFACIELTHSWRQSQDPQLARLLNEVREGACPDWIRSVLESRLKSRDDDDQASPTAPGARVHPTRLCTHKRDAELWNDRMLDQLPGTQKIYMAQDSNSSYSRLLDTTCPAPKKLTLKIGSQVMLLRNLDTQRGLVNGARGIVEGFTSEDSLPRVRFTKSDGGSSKGLLHVVQRERWTHADIASGGMTHRRQLPLALAWAISIHKSQGITLETAELDLSKVFAPGQAYVALSRCRSLSGLRLLDWKPGAIRADQRVIEFYSTLREPTWTNMLDIE